MLRTGPGYSAAVKFRTPQGAEESEVARSRPGLPHPERQLRDRLLARGVQPEDVLELYSELEPCEVPGGNCAPQLLTWWPNVKVTHSAEYGATAESRQRGMAALRAHIEATARRRGQAVDVSTRRLALPEPSEAAVDGPVLLGASFSPFVELADGQHDLVQYLDEVASDLPVPAAPGLATAGYLRLGTDHGREICVHQPSGQVRAVALGSGHARHVNRDLAAFAASLDLLRGAWPRRSGLDPVAAAAWTAEFQEDLASLDGTALADPENWWAVILEQFWDGLL